jgi:agmatinase
MSLIPDNFLALPAPHSSYDSARFAVWPIPYDATTSYRSGTREGPRAIITASQQVELFDEELEGEFYKCGVATIDPLEPSTIGPEAVHQQIYTQARKINRDGKFLIGLGGEHSISSGLIRAAAAQHGKISILQFDAHLDLRKAYQGSPYSHASAMRKALEYAEKVVPVGIRNVSKEEHLFARKAGIKPITARQCLESEEWIDQVLDTLGEKVYVTIDIDGFDPAYAPGTGTPEPGGLDWYTVTGLLRLVAAEKQIVAADVVEILPAPGQSVTEFLAARLAYKLICYIQAGER